MVGNFLTPQAQNEIERMWMLRREAVRVLGLIVAEFKSDPQAVQCFDLRVVKRAEECIKELEPLELKHASF